jgi:O-antigen ligase
MIATAAPQRPDALQRIGFLVAAFLLFLVHSRVFDFVLSFYHIPAITLALAIGFAIFAGGLKRALSNRVGLFFVLLTASMVLSIPFSVWRGGSVTHLQNSWMKGLPIYMVVVGLVIAYGQLRAAFYVMAYSISVLTAIALVYGSTETGRLFLPGGKFGNPNDLAAILLIGLPFWWFILTSARTSRLGRALAVPAMCLILAMLLKTGSRGAMLGFLATMLVLFVRSSSMHKFHIAGAVTLLAIVGILFLPASLRERYGTFLAKSDDDPEEALEDSGLENSAVSSANARLTILFDSIALTLRNPLFGVGAGQFEVAQDERARQRGARKGSWAVTHNSYTQISSEIGIPGLVFFLGALVSCFKVVSECRNARGQLSPEAADLATMAAALHLALVAYSVCALFMSIAYQMYLPVLAGFAVALSAVYQRSRTTPGATEPVAAATAPPLVHPAARRFAATPPRQRELAIGGRPTRPGSGR